MYGETAQVKIGLVSENVGLWAIIGLCPDCHDAIHKDSNRRQKEKQHFETLCRWWQNNHEKPLPLPEGIYDAIMKYNAQD